jgi:phage protein D
MPIADLNNPIVPDFDVIIDGLPLPAEAKAHVISLVVDDSVGQPSMFELKIIGSEDQDNPNRWIDDEVFAIGKEVVVKMGYAGDLEALIKGEITALEPEFASDRLPALTVRGYDRRHRLLRGRKTRTFVQHTDSEIASQIAFESGLAAEVENSRIVLDYVIQANQNDLDFLQERARLVNFEIAINDRTLMFRSVGNNKSEALTFSLQDHVLEFFPRLSASGQVGEVNVRGWNLKEKKAVVGISAIGDENSTMGGSAFGSLVADRAFGSAVSTTSSQPVMLEAEASGIARARFNERVLGFLTGEGVSLGRTDLRAGKVIKIDGVGRKFGGQYYVTSAAHCLDNRNGYRTRFSVKRSAS